MAQLHYHRSDPPATRGRLIRWARYYDPLVSLLTLGRRTQLRQATVALAGFQPGQAVLEVGCGTGDVAIAASALTGTGGTVVGIDPAPEMIAVARRKAQREGAGVDFQLGVIEALALPDHTFDVVLSSLMMHHLPADLQRRGLAEIARVLKAGGRLLIVDFNPTNRFDRVMSHLTFHGRLGAGVQDLAPLLHAAGFRQVEVGDSGFRGVGFVRGQTSGAHGTAECANDSQPG
jgi:demethylmenaquinone methyltransferase/2-methoxy-6-polyprenyl-1,4-benzoquinol methylase/phosphoethanolamine N-methyltransferase